MSSSGHLPLFRSLLSETKDGEWGKDSPFDDSVEMFVIRGTDFDTVRSGSLAGVPSRFIATKNATRKTLRPFDILIETAGGSKGRPTGKTVLLCPKLFESAPRPITCASFARFLRVDPRLANPEYLYWYLQHLYKSGVIENHQVQHTGIARFQFTKFADSVCVPLPPLRLQSEVVSVMAPLADRIALLRETNATLEAIAQALFKSWFVDFDPVHAKQQGLAPAGMDEATAALFPEGFEESALGSMPRGWQTGSILEVADLLSGGTPKTDRSEFWGGDIAWASAKDVSQAAGSILVSTERTITIAGLERSATRLIPRLATVVVARGATTGRMVMFGREMAMNQTCYGLTSKLDAPVALYCLLRREIEAIVNSAHGSVFDTITTSTFARSIVIQSPANILARFEEIGRPLFERIAECAARVQTLATLRDTLLPRLISGQLRLPEADDLLAHATA